MSDYYDEVVSTYKELSKAPSLDFVSVLSDDTNTVLHWQAYWSHRDVVSLSKVNYITTGSLLSRDEELVSVKNPFTSEITTEKMVAFSSSKLKACLREIEMNSEKHDFLEIWKGSQKLLSTDLTKENKHGKVHTNSTFGCLNWSNANDKLVYVAEKKVPQSKSYFEKSEKGDDVGNEFIYREDWGEDLLGCYHATLFMYDINSCKVINMFECLPSDISVGCALWSKDDKYLYILAWKSTPWKLALNGFRNRYSALYELNLSLKTCTSVTPDKKCVFLPRVSPDGSQLIYLESTPFWPHRQCYKMMRFDLTSPRSVAKVVVDLVTHQPNPSCFQGLFIDNIVYNCWLSNGRQLLVSSFHRSNQALLCIDIYTGDVNLLETEGEWTILHITNDIIFVSFSTPNTPAVFKVGKFDPDKIKWLDVDVPVPKLNEITWKILKHEPKEENKQYPGLDYESVLVKPAADTIVKGLIVNPHDGPHRIYHAAFDLFTASFCKLGYAVLRVNFRGSQGFGLFNLLSLPGNIGHQDVKDVQQAAERVIEDLSIPPGKIMIHGGSHGGFLTLHLISQYPRFYSAGAVRNPVANMLIQKNSDCMDWAYQEAGVEFKYDTIPNLEDTRTFLECSPILGVAKVEAPLLFMVGLSDLRVVPAQSFQYIHALQGLGKKVKVLSYSNNYHPIAAVDAEADCFINMTKWFYEHCH